MIFDDNKTNKFNLTEKEKEERWKEIENLKREEGVTYAECLHLAHVNCDIENLDKVTEVYGIYGTYMNYICDPEEESQRGRTPGLYFIYGLDADYIRNCRFHMRALYTRQKHYSGLIHTRAIVVRIGDKDDAVTVRDVMHKARLLQALRSVCSEKNYDIPTDIGLGELEFIHSQLLYSTQSNIGSSKKMCEDMLEACIKDITELDKQDTFFKRKYRTYCFSDRNYLSGKKTKFSLDFLKFCFFGGNRVNYKTIIRRNEKIGTLVIEKIIWKEFKKLLSYYPDCIYAICPGDTGKHVILDPAKKIPKKFRNDRRKNPFLRLGEVGFEGVRIMYPERWADVISYVHHMARFNAYGGVTCEEMMNEGEYAAFVVPFAQFSQFHNLCNDRGIQYAYDLSAINTKEMGGLYDVPVLVRAGDAVGAMRVLRSICKIEMSYRIPEDVTGCSRNYSRFTENGYRYTDFAERGDFERLFWIAEDKSEKRKNEGLDSRKDYYHIIKK